MDLRRRSEGEERSGDRSGAAWSGGALSGEGCEGVAAESTEREEVHAEAERRALEVEDCFSLGVSANHFRVCALRDTFLCLAERGSAVLVVVGSGAGRANAYAEDLGRSIMRRKVRTVFLTHRRVPHDSLRNQFSSRILRMNSMSKNNRLGKGGGSVSPRGVIVVCDMAFEPTGSEDRFYEYLLKEGKLHGTSIEGYIVVLVYDVSHREYVQYVRAMRKCDAVGSPSAAELRTALFRASAGEAGEGSLEEPFRSRARVSLTVAAQPLLDPHRFITIIRRFFSEVPCEAARRYRHEMRFLTRAEASAVWSQLHRDCEGRLPSVEVVSEAVRKYLEERLEREMREEVEGGSVSSQKPVEAEVRESGPIEPLPFSRAKRLLPNHIWKNIRGCIRDISRCGVEVLVPSYGLAYCSSPHCVVHTFVDKLIASKVTLSTEERRGREERLRELVLQGEVDFTVKARELEFPLIVRGKLPATAVRMTHPGTCLLFAIGMWTSGCETVCDVRVHYRRNSSFFRKLAGVDAKDMFCMRNGPGELGLAAFIEPCDFWSVTEGLVQRMRGGGALTKNGLPSSLFAAAVPQRPREGSGSGVVGRGEEARGSECGAESARSLRECSGRIGADDEEGAEGGSSRVDNERDRDEWRWRGEGKDEQSICERTGSGD